MNLDKVKLDKVVARLVELSLPTPEVNGLNPDVVFTQHVCTYEEIKFKKLMHAIAKLFYEWIIT